jgi:phosphoglycolate phosphatase-like HAD superfamily hydrolase
MREKKVLIFNLGGALLMPTDEVIAIWCEAIRSVGLIPDYAKIYLNYDKSYLDVVIPEMAKERGWTDLQVAEIIKFTNKRFHDANMNNNLELPDKLKELKVRGYALGVITDQNRLKLSKGLNKIGCTIDLFDFVSTSDDGFKKPDSRVLAKILEKYRPQEMLIIGQDHHREFMMAQKLGVDFVAITSPTFPIGFWQVMLKDNGKIYSLVSHFINDFLSE